jgi:hypothetical protein
MVMKWRARSIWDSSSLPKRGIAGIPWMSVIAAIYSAFLVFNLYLFVTDALYGVNNSKSAIFMAILYVAALLIWIIAWAAQVYLNPLAMASATQLRLNRFPQFPKTCSFPRALKLTATNTCGPPCFTKCSPRVANCMDEAARELVRDWLTRASHDLQAARKTIPFPRRTTSKIWLLKRRSCMAISSSLRRRRRF